MKSAQDAHLATYGPMQHKSFPGALESFLAHECPSIGGQRTRQVLVQAITDMVQQFYPSTSNLRQGQIQWTAIHKDESGGYGKKITASRLQSVVLDLVPPEDIQERMRGVTLRQMKRDATARLFKQAYDQDGCLTNAEVALLLKISASTVGHYAREWENANGTFLPRRGVIHDLGPTLTHKKAIIEKIVLEGKTIEETCRITNHSPEAVHRYVHTFKQVLLCHRKGLQPAEIAYAVHIRPKLVMEYLDLIRSCGDRNPILKALLSENEIKTNS